MITPRNLLDAELNLLLHRLMQTPECQEVEAFLSDHPDVEIKLPFYSMFKRGFDYHTRSVRLTKKKMERLAGKGAAPPAKAKNRNRISDLIEQMKNDRQAVHDLAEIIETSDWAEKDFPGRQEKFSAELDRLFLKDMMDMIEVPEVVEAQKYKLRMMATDYLRQQKSNGARTGR